MKSIASWLSPVICGGLLPLLGGCFEISVHTVVSGDGSSERIISMQRSDTTLPSTAFPIPSDPTWAIEWKKTERAENPYDYTAVKKFASPEELAHEYTASDTSVLGIRVAIKKRFEWFYTYIDYTETYSVWNPFRDVPATGFMTPEELDRAARGEQNDILKEKADMWFARNMFEKFFASLLREAELRNDPNLPPDLLRSRKEQLFTAIRSDSAGLDDVDRILSSTEHVVGTPAVRSLRPTADSVLKSIEESLSRMAQADGTYNNSVGMPGILIETNSDDVEGTTARWKFESGQLHIRDYVMHAQSRVTNVWTFYVTAGTALALLLFVLASSLRRRSANRGRTSVIAQ